MNETGTWETQVDLVPGQAYAYKFVNGNEWGLDESVPDSCGTPNGLGGFNRLWAFDTASTPGPTLVCWSSCTSCSDSDGADETGAAFCGPGTVWSPDLQLCVGTDEANACPEDITGDGIVTVADLLALLAAFGDVCTGE